MPEEQKREFTGIWIPKIVVEDSRLTWTDRALYAEVASFDSCYMSNETLGKRLGVGTRRVQQIVSRLKECGYIYQEAFDGRKRYLQTFVSRGANGFASGPVERTTLHARDEADCVSGTKQVSPIDNSRENNLDSVSSRTLAVSAVETVEAPSPPKPEIAKPPTELHQLVSYVAEIQGIDPPLNKGAEYKAAKTILATYSLDMAKSTADTMLKDTFWKQRKFTVMNLCSNFPKYKTEPVDPDFDPWEEQNNAVIATMEQWERDQAYIAQLRQEIADAEGGTAHAPQDE